MKDKIDEYEAYRTKAKEKWKAEKRRFRESCVHNINGWCEIQDAPAYNIPRGICRNCPDKE